MTSTSCRALCAGAAAVSLAFTVAGAASSTPAHAAIVHQQAEPAPADLHAFTPMFGTAVRPLVLAEPEHDTALVAELHTRVEHRPAARSSRPAARPALRVVHRTESAPLTRRAHARPVHARSTRSLSRRAVRPAARPVVREARQVRGGMNAVVSYAYAAVGSRYVHGASGGGAYDCSGLTMRAFSRAGIRLPHSARAQAGMAHSVSRGSARPGDLVIGTGHVGIYVGNGYMIAAARPGEGVVRQKLYRGLRIARF